MSTDNKDNKTLLKLRDIRRAKGMTLNVLAEKVGIDYQRVGRMERGETQMTIEMLDKLSKVLHVPITDLLDAGSVANVENKVAQNAVQSKPASLIPIIYERLDLLCSQHEMGADPTVKVHLASVIFNAIEDIHTSVTNDEDLVKVFFEVLDAIFERLVVTKGE